MIRDSWGQRSIHTDTRTNTHTHTHTHKQTHTHRGIRNAAVTTHNKPSSGQHIGSQPHNSPIIAVLSALRNGGCAGGKQPRVCRSLSALDVSRRPGGAEERKYVVLGGAEERKCFKRPRLSLRKFVWPSFFCKGRGYCNRPNLLCTLRPMTWK